MVRPGAHVTEWKVKGNWLRLNFWLGVVWYIISIWYAIIVSIPFENPRILQSKMIFKNLHFFSFLQRNRKRRVERNETSFDVCSVCPFNDGNNSFIVNMMIRLLLTPMFRWGKGSGSSLECRYLDTDAINVSKLLSFSDFYIQTEILLANKEELQPGFCVFYLLPNWFCFVWNWRQLVWVWELLLFSCVPWPVISLKLTTISVAIIEYHPW